MPPRLNKRQLREQEELASLEIKADADVQESEDDDGSEDDVVTQPGKFATFSALAPEEDSSDEDLEQSLQAKKKKKKKKRKGAAPKAEESEVSAVQTHSVPPPPSQPKIAKKKLQKGGKSKQKDDSQDLDKALAELSLKYPTLQRPTQSQGSSTSGDALFSLLIVSLPHLDSEAELRKFFGAKVISSSKASNSGPSGASSRRQNAATRSNLVRPKPTWPPATMREGLSVRQLTNEELEVADKRHGHSSRVPGERIWTVEFSKKYRAIAKTFIQMVMSGDPDGLYQLLRNFPYHADTLLQISEVYYHREEHSTAAEFIDRALFTYERAFLGAFNFTTGSNRLDFDHVENRPFFLALHRQTSDLQRRGCFRTAFEFARLLYSLDPHNDPHGAIFHLEFLAVKTNMTKWAIDMWEAQVPEMGDNPKRICVRSLPGFSYSRALALFLEEEAHHKEHESSTAALREAILKFPAVVPLLADKADISLSFEVRKHSAFRIYTDANEFSHTWQGVLHLLSHLYAQRSHSLWKQAARSAWFASTVNSTLSSLPPSSTSSPSKTFEATFTSPIFTSSVYRHVMVLESTCRRLFSFIPPAELAAKQLSCDPLPPSTAVTSYDNAFFEGVESLMEGRTRNRRQAAQQLEQLLPDPAFRQQLQGVFDANPWLAQLIPGGINQLAEMLPNLPEGMLDDMLMNAGMADNALQDGGMPGQMPGEEGVDELLNEPDEIPGLQRGDGEDSANEEESGDSEDDAPAVSLPIRLLRNVFGLFGGAQPRQPEDDSSSEEEAAADNASDVD